MSTVDRYDAWLQDGGPAALVLRQPLVPVEGEDGIFFPPTYAPGQDKGGFAGGYNIDPVGAGGNVCLVDSVGSQANRMEPLFRQEGYEALVPQITVVADTIRVNLLDAGHRAGDAIVRYSSIQEELRAAFQALLSGNAMPLARVAPTSLVFGVWDSRDTQAKAPRLLAAAVRAYDVSPIHRSAQYQPPVRYEKHGLVDAPEDKATGDKYAQIGLLDQPATWTHGGVIARGGIRREATLHLAALRLLRGGSAEETLRLRRYLLGLALTALTGPWNPYMRQGCNLVPAEGGAALVLVRHDGRRETIALDHADALAYATEAAQAFEVAASREIAFDKEKVKADLKEKADKKAKKGQ